ncbi:wd40 repeat protein [Fusarium globosum]|uniref:Wd40 repeat protein n=1 Tax=Fusarium globosum TaxID=78864 RepID=A0A8H6CY34_9HYPO|nr:wd40 repeat protein [Fusarium globosum]
MVRDSDGSSSRSRTPEPGSASLRSSASSLGRRFTNLLPISRKSTRQVTERAKNEFGLNTVYQPPESSNVIADLVFVHGLGGGSSTTWCIHGDPEIFWPKEWLPKDPGFDGVRVRSFGYNANWSTRAKTPLDVRSFGQVLVEELISDPMIKSPDTPIVLLGHSMGGLRFHSFYFLGTPHRGANLAKFLGNLIRISGKGRKPYIQGLESQSEIIPSLNDSFRVHYAGICLHSFYESQPTPPVGLIVDMESATLGYAEERPQLLNANHKNLIKFRDITDTNYRSLRNRLAATMEQIRANIVTIDKAENPGVKDQKGKLPILSPNPNNRTLPEPLLLYHNTPDDEQLKAIYRYLSMDYGPSPVFRSQRGTCIWQVDYVELRYQMVASLTSRNRVTWKWFVRPSSPPQLLLFEDGMMKLYDWANLSELASAEAPIIPTILGRRDSGPGALNDADAISMSSEGDDLVFVEKLQPTHKDLQIMPSLSQSNTKIHVFDLSFLEAHATLSSRTPAHFSSTASTRSSSAPPRRIQSLSHHSPPPQLHNPFSTTPLESPPNVPPFHAAGSLSSAHRRSSVRNVADVPNVERIVGTVKRFNSWFLVFISREGWVCSVELGGSKVLDTFEKHFFVPTVWRTANSTLITRFAEIRILFLSIKMA